GRRSPGAARTPRARGRPRRGSGSDPRGGACRLVGGRRVAPRHHGRAVDREAARGGPADPGPARHFLLEEHARLRHRGAQARRHRDGPQARRGRRGGGPRRGDPPRARQVEADMTKPRGTGAAPARRLRILIAEDNPVNERVARTLLEKQGHTVLVAHNGREALAVAQREKLDVILMDVQMPEMDGFAATAAIRDMESGTGNRVPIVGVTAHATARDRRLCLAAGMDTYLSKPIRPDMLFAAIDEVIPGRERSRAALPAADRSLAAVQVLDEAGILAVVSGNPGLLRELTELFLEDSP